MDSLSFTLASTATHTHAYTHSISKWPTWAWNERTHCVQNFLPNIQKSEPCTTMWHCCHKLKKKKEIKFKKKRKKKELSAKTLVSFSPLLTHWLQAAQNELEWAMVECARTSTQHYACKGERGKRMGLWGLASNLQGLVSNTIWRETIQFAGIREGEGGTDKEHEQKGQ